MHFEPRERQRDQECERQRQKPETANHSRGPQAQCAELGGLERPETGDDRDGDVGQHHHLEQLDETVRGPRQGRRPLPEEQPGEDSPSEPGENLSRECHEPEASTCYPCVAQAIGRPSSVRNRWLTEFSSCGDSPLHQIAASRERRFSHPWRARSQHRSAR